MSQADHTLGMPDWEPLMEKRACTVTFTVPSSPETLLCCRHLSPGPACPVLHHKCLDYGDNACALLAVDLPTKRSPDCSTLQGKIT